MLFALSFGAFVARVATHVLAPAALGIFDFVVDVALALSVALAYRRFVRNALIQRRLDRARRAAVSPARPDDEAPA